MKMKMNCFEIHIYDFSYDFFDSNVFIFLFTHKNGSDEEVAAGEMIIAICVENDERKKTSKQRNVWVKPSYRKENRMAFIPNFWILLEDFEMYKNKIRMKPENFDEILHFVRYKISKDTTHLREPIAPEIKLAITIRFLATGNTYRDLSSAYRVHNSSCFNKSLSFPKFYCFHLLCFVLFGFLFKSNLPRKCSN